MSRAARSRRSAMPSELNLTPLLDVILNLLFFFILATNIKTDEFLLELTLPSSSTAIAAQEPPQVPRIQVAADGSLMLDGTPIAAPQLQETLIARRERDGINEAILESDGAVTMQQLITVTDLCRAAGLRQVSPRVLRPTGATP